MRRPKVAVHIGSPKTGSTFLQNVFAMNSELLAAHGIVYVAAGQTSNHHYRLARALGFSSATDVEESEHQAVLEEVRAELSETDAAVRLFSSEHFDLKPTPKAVAAFANFFADYDVSVILFLRNQVDYAQSLYFEFVKWGGIQSYENFTLKAIEDRVFDYLWKASLWSEAGLEVRLVDYDACRGVLLSQFLDCLGCCDGLADALKQPAKGSNLSLSPELMEFVRLLNAGVALSERRQFFLALRERVEAERPDWMTSRPIPLPPAIEHRLTEMGAQNRELARRMGHDPNAFLGGNLVRRGEDRAACRPPDPTALVEDLHWRKPANR